MIEVLLPLLIQIIMVVSLATTIISVYFAVNKNFKYYWVGGLSSYVLSFICSWSIGLYFLIVPFVLFALAFTHAIKVVKNPFHSALVIIVSIITWWLCINNINDYWLWLPFSYIS